MPKARQAVPVSLRALVARINRKLAPDEMLKATRGERWRDELGDFYLVDLDANAVMAKHVDPESYGRKLGVLKAWERLQEE